VLQCRFIHVCSEQCLSCLFWYSDPLHLPCTTLLISLPSLDDTWAALFLESEGQSCHTLSVKWSGSSVCAAVMKVTIVYGGQHWNLFPLVIPCIGASNPTWRWSFTVTFRLRADCCCIHIWLVVQNCWCCYALCLAHCTQQPPDCCLPATSLFCLPWYWEQDVPVLHGCS